MKIMRKTQAKLALLGMEANIQTVTIPDKGVCHRVRTGPYQNSKEMNDARAALKQNGMDVDSNARAVSVSVLLNNLRSEHENYYW